MGKHNRSSKVFERLSPHRRGRRPVEIQCKQEDMEIEITGSQSVLSMPAADKYSDYLSLENMNLNSSRKRLHEDEPCDLPRPKSNSKRVKMECPLPAAEKKPTYDPGVQSWQSNYFYNNKLLFELHLERLQRSGWPSTLGSE